MDRFCPYYAPESALYKRHGMVSFAWGGLAMKPEVPQYNLLAGACSGGGGVPPATSAYSCAVCETLLSHSPWGFTSHFVDYPKMWVWHAAWSELHIHFAAPLNTARGWGEEGWGLREGSSNCIAGEGGDPPKGSWGQTHIWGLSKFAWGGETFGALEVCLGWRK